MICIQFAAQCPPRRENLLFILHRHTRRFACLLGIRSEQIRSVVARYILRLGINQNLQCIPLRRGSTDIRQKCGVNHTLAVIGHHNHIKSRNQARKSFAYFMSGLCGHGRTVFLVQPDHLLITRQYPDFYCSRTLFASDQMRRYPGITQHAVQTLTIRITATQGDQRRFSAQGHNIARDVARSAEKVTLFLYFYHRNRSLRRDTLRVSHQIGIQHDITDHQNALASQSIQAVQQLSGRALLMHAFSPYGSFFLPSQAQGRQEDQGFQSTGQ